MVLVVFQEWYEVGLQCGFFVVDCYFEDVYFFEFLEEVLCWVFGVYFVFCRVLVVIGVIEWVEVSYFDVDEFRSFVVELFCCFVRWSGEVDCYFFVVCVIEEDLNVFVFVLIDWVFEVLIQIGFYSVGVVEGVVIVVVIVFKYSDFVVFEIVCYLLKEVFVIVFFVLVVGKYQQVLVIDFEIWFFFGIDVCDFFSYQLCYLFWCCFVVQDGCCKLVFFGDGICECEIFLFEVVLVVVFFVGDQ